MRKNTDIYVQAFQTLAIMVLLMALFRFSKGYAIFILVLLGVFQALAGKVVLPLGIYALFSLCIVVSGVLLPKEGPAWGYGLRGGVLGISLAMIIGARRRLGTLKLELGSMIPFLCAAALSLYDSWVPQVSALKLIQFSLFLFGMWIGTQNLHRRPEELKQLRVVFLAFSMFLILGSVAVYPFPSIAFALNLRYAIKEVGTEAAVADFLANFAYTKTLFCGITNQSQALAPITVIVFTWVACDMLFVEKRFRWLHVLLLLLAMPVIYMTRSRVGFFSLTVSIFLICFFTSKKMMVSVMLKQRLMRGVAFFVIAVILGAIVSELRNDAISRWLRKTDDVHDDTRSWTEAITTSRQGLIEMCLDEFKRNPVVGSGFQVAWYSKYKYEDAGGGLVLSSSIEKGILPVMVLGETGIIGAFAFAFFLIYFYSSCIKKKYFITITMFTVLLATNMGEATFFSPGGIGGIEWAFCIVGGFSLDTINLTNMWVGLRPRWA